MRVDYKVVPRKLFHESLKIEATFLQEGNILVTHGLLWWHAWDDDARPALDKGILKEEKLVVATLDLPGTLQVRACHIVDDVAVVVLRVTDSEPVCVGISENALITLLLLREDVRVLFGFLLVLRLIVGVVLVFRDCLHHGNSYLLFEFKLILNY